MSPTRLTSHFGLIEQREPRHGTNGGFVRHQKRGETPCEDCRKARRLYERGYRARRLGRDFAGFDVSDAVDLIGEVLAG